VRGPLEKLLIVNVDRNCLRTATISLLHERLTKALLCSSNLLRPDALAASAQDSANGFLNHINIIALIQKIVTIYVYVEIRLTHYHAVSNCGLHYAQYAATAEKLSQI
jgi:hypothetical protein